MRPRRGRSRARLELSAPKLIVSTCSSASQAGPFVGRRNSLGRCPNFVRSNSDCALLVQGAITSVRCYAQAVGWIGGDIGADHSTDAFSDAFDLGVARQWTRQRSDLVQPKLREIRRLCEATRRQYIASRKAKVEAELAERLSKTPIDKMVHPYNRDLVVKLKSAGIDYGHQLASYTVESLVNDVKIRREAANRLIQERRRLEKSPRDDEVPMNPNAWKQDIDHDFVRAWLLARSAQTLEKSQAHQRARDHASAVRSVQIRLSPVPWTLFPRGREKTVKLHAALVSGADSPATRACLDEIEQGLTEHAELMSVLESFTQIEDHWRKEPESVRRTIAEFSKHSRR